ncbi:hypothetical protein M3665_25420, partial [Bacillus licheniformis]|nr:hypothetical protein [Bacillus licheniformis]
IHRSILTYLQNVSILSTVRENDESSTWPVVGVYPGRPAMPGRVTSRSVPATNGAPIHSAQETINPAPAIPLPIRPL